MSKEIIFENIYNETYEDLLKYVILNCKNINDVNDILQNIYMAIYKKIKRNFNMNKSYIYGIAKHKIKDYYRFKYRKKQEIEEIDIPDAINIEEEMIKQDNIDKIWAFLIKQNSLIAKIFYLYYYLDLSIKEIAILLNLTESNVKNYLYRSLKKLNIYLDKEGNHE